MAKRLLLTKAKLMSVRKFCAETQRLDIAIEMVVLRVQARATTIVPLIRKDTTEITEKYLDMIKE